MKVMKKNENSERSEISNERSDIPHGINRSEAGYYMRKPTHPYAGLY